MSYALRNSLILMIVFLLFVAGGWGYIHYYQTVIIEKKEKKLSSQKKVLKQKQQIADQYQSIATSYQQARTYFNHFKKALYLSSDEDKVFDFLVSLNRGVAENDFNFTFKDSTLHPKYGVINMHIDGKGRYRNVVNFMRGIEQSKPLNKIENVKISPIHEDNTFNKVGYNFDLKSYYYRSKILEQPSFSLYQGLYTSVDNPFFPLVHDIPPNTAHKINVEKSKLVALSNDRIFLIDQTGKMREVKVGEGVYLGKLTSINLNTRMATFVLNKGGIKKTITLGTQHEDK